MAIRTPLGPREHGARLIAEAIDRDGRDQKDIAAQLDISEAQLSRLKTGERTLNVAAAMDIEDRWPEQFEPRQLVDVARDIRDANLRARRNGANPGWLCLPPITAISDVARRTLVPFFPRPVAHLA